MIIINVYISLRAKAEETKASTLKAHAMLFACVADSTTKFVPMAHSLNHYVC